MRAFNKNTASYGSKMTGLTLIELMIALVLGLLVMGAAIGMFVSNREVYRATESLSRVQENSRVAFELMAREVREAGGNPCSRSIPVANVLEPHAGWWNDWSNGIRGYDAGANFAGAPFGAGAGGRVDGTDAVELRSGSATEATVTDHLPTSAQFKVSSINHGLLDKDIVLVCDFVQAAIFQISNAQSGINNTVVHNKGQGTPGNCSKGLGYAEPIDCSANGTPYAYGPNSIITRLRATAWYIGNNGRGGRSLYQAGIVNNGGTINTVAQEITEGVEDMEIEYLLPGATTYVDATAVGTQWPQVTAARIVLTLQGSDRVGTDGSRIAREVAHVVSLRNRSS